MIIKTFYNDEFHEIEVRENDIVKISSLSAMKKWFTLAQGQLVKRNFGEGSMACGQPTFGIMSASNKFIPLVEFSSNYTKIEIIKQDYQLQL